MNGFFIMDLFSYEWFSYYGFIQIIFIHDKSYDEK